MAKHKYDAVVMASRKAAKDKVKSDTAKKTTVKDVADRLVDVETIIGLK
jgi:hypothetical protein